MLSFAHTCTLYSKRAMFLKTDIYNHSLAFVFRPLNKRLDIQRS